EDKFITEYVAKNKKTPQEHPDDKGKFYPNRLAIKLIEYVDKRLIKLLNATTDQTIQNTIEQMKLILESGAVMNIFLQEDGRNCLKFLAEKTADNKDYETIIDTLIKATKYRTAEVRKTILQEFDRALPEDLEKIFEDILEFDTIFDPVILPEGQT